MEIIAKKVISNPDILFIHQRLLNLNFFLNVLTIKTKKNHHNEAPINTPNTNVNRKNGFPAYLFSPKAVKEAAKNTIVNGLVIVRRKVDAKYPRYVLLLVGLLICATGLVKNILTPTIANMIPPINLKV